jgi:hypothetical protein
MVYMMATNREQGIKRLLTFNAEEHYPLYHIEIASVHGQEGNRSQINERDLGLTTEPSKPEPFLLIPRPEVFYLKRV